MQVKNSPKAQSFLASAAGKRFIKFAGMLTSDFEGERANAAQMATKLLQEAQLTWAEVMSAGTGNGHSPGFQRFSDGTSATHRAQLAAERDANRRLRQMNQKLTAENNTLSLEAQRLKQDGTKLRAEITSLLMKLNIAEGEVTAAKRAFEQAGTSPQEAAAFFQRAESVKMQTPKRGLKAGTRSFETPLQKQLNELIDEIEDQIELNDWETGFLTSLRDLKWKITDKQFFRLEKLADQAGLDITDYVERAA